jgi:hypothetical protein
MDRLRFVLATVFLGLAGLGGLVVRGQQNLEDPPGHVPSGGIQAPTHLLVMTPFVLPELQSELGLSAAQVTQLQNLKQQMLIRGKTLSNQIAAKRKELDTLLAPGTSKGDLVKKLFEQIGSLKGDQLFAGYQTAIKMKAALTEAQRNKLAAMKPKALHQAMTSGMSMNDRMEMMQFMGEEVMMSEGMAGTPASKLQ